MKLPFLQFIKSKPTNGQYIQQVLKIFSTSIQFIPILINEG
ncbi:hypothetical protein [Leptospira bouyouniensis]|nr:hypothetical protein [Leptospira bouyouniensis]